VDEGKKNRHWLADLGKQHDVGQGFQEVMQEMLETHGLLDESLPAGVRSLVEETYLREHNRERRHEESVQALRDWKASLEDVAETLREARRLLDLTDASGQAGAAAADLTPTVPGTDSIH